MAKGDPVYTITGAQRALSDEQSGRTKRYLISMGIRTACFIGAILVPGWPRWVLVAGALVLPYLAVVVANAGRENDEPGDLGVIPLDRTALPPAAPMTALPHEGTIHEGTIHDETIHDETIHDETIHDETIHDPTDGRPNAA